MKYRMRTIVGDITRLVQGREFGDVCVRDGKFCDWDGSIDVDHPRSGYRVGTFDTVGQAECCARMCRHFDFSSSSFDHYRSPEYHGLVVAMKQIKKYGFTIEAGRRMGV